MVAAQPALLEADAPGWARRFALRLQSVFWPVYPTGPMRLWPVKQSNLPPAADWPGCVVFVSDLNKLGLSTGTAWVNATGGPL